MARGGQGNEGVARRSKAIPLARPNDVALLGASDSPAEQPLHPQASPVGDRPNGPINIANVLQLLEWQSYRCALTGRQLTPETASLDHIVPVRDGGKHVMENVQVLHKDINRAKSTLALDQFIQLCREVVEHAAAANTEGNSP